MTIAESSEITINRNRQAIAELDPNEFLIYMLNLKKSEVFFTPEMGEWLTFCYGNFLERKPGDIRKTIRTLQAYRGSGKTTIITILGICWVLLMHPNISIGIYTKEITWAINILKAVGLFIESHKYKELFSAVYGKKYDQLLIVDKKNEKTLDLPLFKNDALMPTLSALSIGGNDTGRHFDLAVSDDVVSAKDAYSQKDRDKCEEKMIDLISNILRPGGTCVFVGTPHHHSDGYVFIDRRYSKALSDTDYKFRKYALGSLEKDTPERVAELKKSAIDVGGPKFFKQHLLLELVADDTNEPFVNIKESVFDENRTSINIEKIYAAIDPAYSGKDSTAVVIVFSTRSSNNIYFLGKMWVENSLFITEKIVNFLIKYGVEKTFVETNKDEGYLIDKMKKIYEKRYEFSTIIPVHNTTVKANRIMANIEPKLERLILLKEESDEIFIQQIKGWTVDATLDDAPDALALCLEKGFNEKKEVSENFIVDLMDDFI